MSQPDGRGGAHEGIVHCAPGMFGRGLLQQARIAAQSAERLAGFCHQGFDSPSSPKMMSSESGRM